MSFRQAFCAVRDANGAVRDAKALRCPNELTRDRTRLSTVAQFKTLANVRSPARISAVLLTGNLSRVVCLQAHIAGLFRSLRRRFLQLAVPLIESQWALHCTNQTDWKKRCRERLLPSNLAKGESCSQRASPQGSPCLSALLCFSFGHVAHIGRSWWHCPFEEAFEEASGRSVGVPLSATQLWRLRNLGVSPLNAAWDAQSARAGSLRHRSERWILSLELQVSCLRC